MSEEKTHAHKLAKKQTEISIAEFFEKNRHLLGFDNPRKALLTVVKEAVDNSLDACEEVGILPEIMVNIFEIKEGRYRIVIEDNGPGIVKEQIPKIFGKLLYGSKFFKLSQTRGQQGIGISAAVLYAQLTTGKPAKIISRISKKHQAHVYYLKIDTKSNKPEIVDKETIEWVREHGTRIEIEIDGNYQKGRQSVDEYMRQTAIVNPHATFIYTTPKAEQFIFPRITEKIPHKPKEIKPHLHGVELGTLLKMISLSKEKTLSSFLINNFTRVGKGTVDEICKNAAILPNISLKKITREDVEKLIKAIQKTKIMAPPTDSISPIGKELLERGLKNEVIAEFYSAVTRPPGVYRGNPFIIEAAVCYGGDLPKDKQAKIMRFANKVPLQYEQGACAITKSISQINWRKYGLSQSNGAIPVGPVVFLVHIASVWVPFTSESKEAIAHYPEIMKEIKLALQECGRQLGNYLRKKKNIQHELKKKSYIEKYIPHIADSLKNLLGLGDLEEKEIEEKLKEMLDSERNIKEVGKIELTEEEKATFEIYNQTRKSEEKENQKQIQEKQTTLGGSENE